MSWLDLIKNDLIITTPDGKQYKPNWLRASKQTEWNFAEFDFIGKEGTLVKKSKRKGRRLSMDLFFQGEDHLATAEAFEKSCNDERAINFQHPFYGTLTVQIPSILQDNSLLNVSKLTCVIIETIAENNPVVTLDAVDQIPRLKEILDTDLELALTAPLTSADTTRLKNTTNNIYAKGVPLISIPEEFQAYNNAFATASAYINTATATPLLAIRTTIAMINKPALFAQSTEQRLNTLIDQYNDLKDTVTFLTTVGAKQLYMIQANSLISTMCQAAVTPLPGNYTNNTSVFKIIDKLIEQYDRYITDLDALQGLNGGNPLSFIPDANTIIQLDNLFNMTISNLELIALSSRKERFLFLEEDTNLSLLTQRLYSLDDADNNMVELMENNNLGPNDILQLKKGRKIVYYI